jgi:hypothetical protein
LYEILRNSLCWSISLVIKYSIDLCNKRIRELFQSVLPIIFKLFLTSTSMLSNHARVQIDARHQFISHLIINYLIMQILYYTEYHEGNYWKRFLSLSILYMSNNSVLTFTYFLMTNILIIITKINNECLWRITLFIFFKWLIFNCAIK